MDDLSHDVHLDTSHSDAIDRVQDALAAEGFGVLTRIDVHDALREKLGVDFRPYTILGACNPGLAHVALEAAPEIGVLLPCNVTVEQDGEGVLIRIVNAATMMKMSGYGEHSEIGSVGRDADEHLRRVVEVLRDGSG